MEKERKPLSTYALKNLMLETLDYKGNDIDSEGKHFAQYGYAGTQNDLFRLGEALAIKKKLIPSTIDVVKRRGSAWGGDGYNLHEGSNTNFLRIEIERLFEVFGILQNQNIIAPGMYGNSPFLPFFHVTDHGLECIKQREILPFDFDGYLDQIRNIPNIDTWVLYYMTEAVRCFNTGSYNASTIMIGLSAEKLAIDLMESFKQYLTNHKSRLKPTKNLSYSGDVDTAFIKELDKAFGISTKYQKFIDYFEEHKGHNPAVKTLDKSARKTFFTYIRLIRNEVTHPNDIKKDETETLLLFVSFIKYIKLQTDLTNIFKTVK
ncbi:hypothetical protein ACU3L3_14275 [Priestia endophytica]